LVREIEATPPEYWDEILATLRQFREHVTQQKSRVVDVEQRRQNQDAIDLLQSWVEEGDSDAGTLSVYTFLPLHNKLPENNS
jgi:uncharacterized protein YgbK (DUF1537 family)